MESLKRSQSLPLFFDGENSVVYPRKDSYREGEEQRDSNKNSSLDAASASGGDETTNIADSGLCDRSLDGELQVLEQKIDRLSDMFLDQCRLLETMKDEIRSSKAMVEDSEFVQNDIIYDVLKKTLRQSMVPEEENGNSRAKCLLDAIELRQKTTVDSEIRDVLVDFLQSEDLKESMVKATAESVKDVIDSCLSHDVTALYLPILEHSHRRLLRHVASVVEDAFRELEEYQGSLSKSVYKISKSLQRAVQRHRTLLTAATDPQKNLVTTLKCTVEELLSKELKQWRQKVVEVFTPPLPEPEELPEPPNLDFAPASPAQPADPQRNIIDQLMISVEISNQIARGEVNAAFERALCAADLTLVMAACRAARGVCGEGGARCRLRPHVLLALLQQLSTDMLHDTQLKCRYLEDAILNLEPHAPATRAHLPLVVGEVRRHLSAFLAAFPHHAASKRIALIIMAADNLLR